ncbi:NACHT domain-containing protein, partial [Nostoc sp. NIES-2111]
YVFKRIINIFIRRNDSNELANSRNRVQQMLLKQVSTEVESRISISLHNRVYILLDVEQNPSQIELPWESEIKVGSKPKIHLTNTNITAIYDQADIAGRLLILGVPGLGKTTMLLKLAEELVNRAKNDPAQPIPVLFSLSSWKNDSQSIKDWLVDQLKDKYGVRNDIGKGLVENLEIIPLLDGLDEIAAERQEKCVVKINDFLHAGWSNPLVVCSRTEEYQHYATLLQLNNSLELCPFTPEQVYQYFRKHK